MLQTAFGPSCINQSSVFEWHKRFKEARESVREDERCGRSKEVNRPELIGQRVRVRVYYVEVLREFSKRFPGKCPVLFKFGHWHFQQDNAPVYNYILVTDYLTKIGIKTVPQPPYSLDLAPCDFCLFPKLRGCRYETIEEMKKAVTKVIDTLTQNDFHWGLWEVVVTVQVHCSRRRLLRRGLEFHVCTMNKSAHTKKKSGNLFNDPRTEFSSIIHIPYFCVENFYVVSSYLIERRIESHRQRPASDCIIHRLLFCRGVTP